MEGIATFSVLNLHDSMLPDFLKKQKRNPPKSNDDYVRLLINGVNDELGPPAVDECYLDTILSDMIRFVRISLNIQGHKYWMEVGPYGLEATEPSSSSESSANGDSIKSSDCIFHVIFEGARPAVLVHNLGELRTGKPFDCIDDEEDMEYADVCVVVGVHKTMQAKEENLKVTEVYKPSAIYVISREGVQGDDNPSRQGMFVNDKLDLNIKFMNKIGHFTFAKIADSIEDLLLRPADKPLVLTEMYDGTVSLVNMELNESSQVQEEH